MRQEQPPSAAIRRSAEGESSFGKILVVVAILGLIAVGAAFVWKSENPPKPYDFEPIYDAPPPNAKKVLWIGNSHMWWWDLPVEMQKTVPDGQEPMWFELVAQPGWRLDQHVRSSQSIRAAAEGWDVIMLQPQSVEPVAQPEQFVQAVRAWERIAAENGAELIVWAPWGRDPNNDGYGIYKREWSGGSLSELTNRMEEATANATQSGSVCPLGAAWLRAFRKHPKAPLWSEQAGNHASQFGNYLNTAMLYACLWKRDPREITYVPKLVNADSAEKLRIVAWETAVDKGIIEGELPGDDAGAGSEEAQQQPSGDDPDQPMEPGNEPAGDPPNE